MGKTTIARLIAAEAGEDAIVEAAFKQGGTLSDRARDLVLAGVTSVEEAVRVARQETATDPAEAA